MAQGVAMAGEDLGGPAAREELRKSSCSPLTEPLGEPGNEDLEAASPAVTEFSVFPWE